MPKATSSGSPIAEFGLSDHEALALSISKLWLMHEDRRVENSLTGRYLKARVFADYATAIGSGLRTLDDAALARVDQPHRDELRGAIQINTGDRWEDLVSNQGVLGSLWDGISGRDRALVLAIEVAAFSPWGDRKVLPSNEDVRAERLSFLGENLNAEMAREEPLELDRELRSTIKGLLKRPVNWLLVGAVGVGGAAIGAASGGLAAPAVGSAVGSSMGLGGAAATNAGLALLGGGSLATGGFGMAGGTALIATTAAVGGGVMAAGVRVAVDGVTVKVPKSSSTAEEADLAIPATAAEAAVDGAKLCVLAQQVVLEEQSDIAKARLIANAVEESRDATKAMIKRLGGGNPADRHADELTHIGTVLERTAKELDHRIEDWSEKQNA